MQNVIISGRFKAQVGKCMLGAMEAMENIFYHLGSQIE